MSEQPGPTQIICPVCKQAETVEKVSSLYIKAVEAGKAGRSASDFLQARPLQQALAPPNSGKKTVTRLIHPDTMVIVFSLVAPFFLAGIASSQAGMLAPTLGLLVAGYAAYLWQRQRLIRRFKQQEAQEKAEKVSVEQRIAGWMKLYYCAEDEVVFAAGSEESAPVEQMQVYLAQK